MGTAFPCLVVEVLPVDVGRRDSELDRFPPYREGRLFDLRHVTRSQRAGPLSGEIRSYLRRLAEVRSSLEGTLRGCEVASRRSSRGAIDFMTKPDISI